MYYFKTGYNYLSGTFNNWFGKTTSAENQKSTETITKPKTEPANNTWYYVKTVAKGVMVITAVGAIILVPWGVIAYLTLPAGANISNEEGNELSEHDYASLGVDNDLELPVDFNSFLNMHGSEDFLSELSSLDNFEDVDVEDNLSELGFKDDFGFAKDVWKDDIAEEDINEEFKSEFQTKNRRSGQDNYNFQNGLPFQISSDCIANITRTARAAFLDDGNFVVAWAHKTDGISYDDIYARRYNITGPVGDEFIVNNYRNFTQMFPAISGLNGGGYVFTWVSENQDGDDNGVFATQRDIDGNVEVEEFRVNEETAGPQQDATVTRLNGGGYAIMYAIPDGSNFGVAMKIYDVNGQVIVNEFQLNEYTLSWQYYTAIAASKKGNIFALWSSWDQPGDDSWYSVVANSYNSTTGIAYGDPFLVNTHTEDTQTAMDLAVLENGEGVVVWMSRYQDDTSDPENYGVYKRHINETAPIGEETLVNTHTEGDQKLPKITNLANGDYVIAWAYNNMAKGEKGTYGQRFTATGERKGKTEFRIGDFCGPVDVTRFNTKGFVVVWSQVEGGVQHIYGRTSMPRIVNNRFNISEVTELTVTPEMLLAGSMWAGPGDLFYTIENLEHVHFFEENNRTNVREAFSQEEINNGDIGIRDDGSEYTPYFDIVLSDGDFERTYPAQIYFTNVNNHYPEFINNQVTIIDNEPVVITSNDIFATDFDSPDDEIVFRVRNFFSRFERRSNPGMTIPEFVQHEIGAGGIQFVPTTNGNNEIPSYEISARDNGGLETEYYPGNVTMIDSDTTSDTISDTMRNGTTSTTPSFQPVIIGVISGVTGCVLIVVICTTVSFVAFSMKIKKQKLANKEKVCEEIELTPDSLTAKQIKKKLPNRWIISHKDISIIEKIGKGGGGTIFTATWKNTLVVYKVCALNNEIDIERFKREVILMMEAKHPNVATAFGYCIDPRRAGIIMEYMKLGSLERVLSDKTIELSWGAKYIFVCDILRGLAYLHASEIIHRDLKPANILIYEEEVLHAKITDFGLSKEFTENQTATSRQMGTFQYMDPCLFKENKKPVFKKESDMYSTGVILLQIATRKEPFKDVVNKRVIPSKILNGKLPFPVPKSNCPLFYKEFIQECCSLKRKKRPTAEDMLKSLEKENVKKAITGYGI